MSWVLCALQQVGQELEDVLTERDALRLVNKELAKRVTSPADPCTRCTEAGTALPSRSAIHVPRHLRP